MSTHVVDLNFTPERVKRLRARLGLSQAEFAKRLAVSQRIVSWWETGERKPGHYLSLQTLYELEQTYEG